MTEVLAHQREIKDNYYCQCYCSFVNIWKNKFHHELILYRTRVLQAAKGLKLSGQGEEIAVS